MTDKSKAGKQFSAHFKNAFDATHQKNVKEQENYYYRLTNFINELTSSTDIDSCLDVYFVLYPNYADDSRSKMIFAVLLTRSISQSPILYLKELAKTLDEKQAPTSRIRIRFDQLGDNEKNQIRGSLRKAIRESESILDELKLAYAASHDRKLGSTDDLYNFDPLPNRDLETRFRSLTTKCKTDWDACGKQFDDDKWTQVIASLQSLRDFLTELRKEELKLFQVLKWCREPLLATIKKSGSRTETHKVPYDALTDQVYLWTVFDLFRRAATVKALVANRAGFTKLELEFFYKPVRDRLYYSNYIKHYYFGLKDVDGFYDVSAWHLWLVQFAKSRGVSLVNGDTFEKIIGILKAITKVSEKSDQTTSSQPAGTPKRLSTKNLATWNYAKDYFQMGKRIGAGAGEFDIVYFEKEDTAAPVIYVEFVSVRGHFFEMDISNFTARVEATPRLIIWRDNQGLIRLIGEYFAFLFTIFAPGFGYFGLFLKEGFTGVLKQVVTEEVIDRVIDQATKVSGLSGDGDMSSAASVLSILTGRKKRIVERLGKLAEREALRQAEADARILERNTVPLLERSETEAARLTRQDLRGLGVSNVGAQEERAAAERIIEQQENKTARQLQNQEQKALEKQEAKRAEDLRSTGVKNKQIADRKTPKVSLVERNVAERSPEPPGAIKARDELARDLEKQYFPDDTRVKLPRTPRTDAGRAQNLAATPKGSRTVMDVDIEIDFSDKIRRTLGLPLRNPAQPKLGVVAVDGIEFKSEKYLLQEHKEVQAIWENSHFSRGAASGQIDKMLQKHVDVARVLEPYGCLGFHYSTNAEEMLILLSERIAALRASLKDRVPNLTVGLL